jgi:hypothetical protein
MPFYLKEVDNISLEKFSVTPIHHQKTNKKLG